MKTLTRALATLAVAGAGTLAYGSLIERNNFTLRRFTVPVLPAGALPIRVLHISDFHLLPRQRRKRAWIAALADLKLDLVINTGDNISHPDSVGPVLDALGALLSAPGAFVLGSNDYFVPVPRNPMKYFLDREPQPKSERLPTESLVLGLGERGWRDLTNARSRLTVKGLEIALVGVDDPHLRYDNFDSIPADDADLPTPDVRLAVTHAPYTRVLDQFVADGADMIFAGHTHGGQLAVPGFGPIITNCDLDTGRAKGLSRWWPGAGTIPKTEPGSDAAWLHVCAGLGTSPWAPVRIAARPEASLLTLMPRSGR